MRILLVSDIESEYIWDHFDPSRFKDVELIISCGDLKSDYLAFLATMINVPVFFIHGNHDTDYVPNPPGGCDSLEDKIVTFKGLRIGGLGGCLKYNNHPTNSAPPFQYTEWQMAWRVRKLMRKISIHKGLDILVTHAPPLGVEDDKDRCHVGFESFHNILDKYAPKYLLHGHMHMRFGRAQRIVDHKGTKVIDAFGYYILDV